MYKSLLCIINLILLPDMLISSFSCKIKEFLRLEIRILFDVTKRLKKNYISQYYIRTCNLGVQGKLLIHLKTRNAA